MDNFEIIETSLWKDMEKSLILWPTEFLFAH